MDAAGEGLADRLRALLVVGPEVDERRMFGTRAFLVEGRILAGARPGGVLLIRVPEDDEAALLQHVGASRADGAAHDEFALARYRPGGDRARQGLAVLARYRPRRRRLSRAWPGLCPEVQR